MDYVPAIALLTAFVIIFLVVMRKLSSEQLLELFGGTGFLLPTAAILSCVLTVFYLFQASAWSGDVLKVVLGVFLGASGAYAGSVRARREESEPEGSPGALCTPGQLGKLPDLDKLSMNVDVDTLRGDIAEVRRLVVDQYARLSASVSELTTEKDQRLDFLFNSVFERGPQEMVLAMQVAIQTWQADGWKLRSFSSDYAGLEASVLLFTRPARGEHSQFFYYHGADPGRSGRLPR